MNEAERLLKKHFKMYDWSAGESQAINDFILTIRGRLQEDIDAIRNKAADSPKDNEA